LGSVSFDSQFGLEGRIQLRAYNNAATPRMLRSLIQDFYATCVKLCCTCVWFLGYNE